VESSEFESRHGKNIVSSVKRPGLFWGPPILLLNGYGVLSWRYSDRGVKSSSQLYVVQKLMTGALPILHLFMKAEASWNAMAHAQKPYFVFRRNGRVHLNRRGASVESTTGSRGMRIGGSNAGFTMFRGSVKGTGYPLYSPVSPSLPLPASPCAITFQLESNRDEIRFYVSDIFR